MTVEAIYMVFVTRTYFFNLEKGSGEKIAVKEFWSFSWPLMLMQISENGVLFALNIFLGQLANPDLAIASFGIVYGLVRIVLAGPRSMVQAAQALVSSREDLRTMFHFAFGLTKTLQNTKVMLPALLAIFCLTLKTSLYRDVYK